MLLLVGFFVLTHTDPMGRNWASHWAPFLILAAYVTILIGIVFPEPSMVSNENLPPSSPSKPNLPLK